MNNNPENNGSIVISAFGGLGKSHFARKYPDLATDLEAVPYRYSFTDPEHIALLDQGLHEHLKGLPNRTINPEFPANYVRAIESNLGRKALILIVLSPETLASLEQRGITYSIVYPDRTMQDELIARMKSRGNNDRFVSSIRHILSDDTEKNTLLTTYHPERFFMATGNEFLEEIIHREYPSLLPDEYLK